MPERKYINGSGLAAILVAKRSAGVTPELNLRNLLNTGDEAFKEINPGIKTQGRRHQRSKTGLSVAPSKGLKSSIFFTAKKTQHNRDLLLCIIITYNNLIIIFLGIFNMHRVFVCQKSCCDASKFKIYLNLKGNRSRNSIGWSHANLRIAFQLPFIIWKVIPPWCVCCKWSQTESSIFVHVVYTGKSIQCHNKLKLKWIHDLKGEYFQGISVHIVY